MTAEKSLLSPKDQLDTELTRIQSDPVLRYARWGFAVYDPQIDRSVNDTARRADKIMYENKRTGKEAYMDASKA